MVQGRTSNAKRLVLLLWLLVAFFYFYLSYDYIRVTSNDREFVEYLQYIVNVAGSEGRTAKDVRDLLFIKAQELSLPLRRDQIQIKSGRNTLDVFVNYDVDIEIPLIQREIYTKKFEHKASYNGPR
jgi:hypothetical protein